MKKPEDKDKIDNADGPPWSCPHCQTKFSGVVRYHDCHMLPAEYMWVERP
jgi:hypothetical protein